LGIAIAVAAFIYILAMASVPMETAQQWAGSPIPTGDVSLAAIDITLPLGPYLMVPALLAVIATAVFLAFVLTEDRYSVTLYDTLVYESARHWILLGVPYSRVRERWGDPEDS
jgi:apolipoprotein N-acyltransferase